MRIRQKNAYIITDSTGGEIEYILAHQTKDGGVSFYGKEDANSYLVGKDFDKETWKFVGMNGKNYQIVKPPEKTRISGNPIKDDKNFTGNQKEALEGIIRILSGLGDKSLKYTLNVNAKDWVINVKPYIKRPPNKYKGSAPDERTQKAFSIGRTKDEKLKSIKNQK